MDGAGGDEVRVRGAGPLGVGAPVQMGHLERAGDRQGGALHIIIPFSRLAQLSGRQSENSPLQGAHRVVAVAGGVADFGGADEGADVGVQHVFVGAVKPAIQVAAGVGVHIAVVPRLVVIAVLADHQSSPVPIESAFVVVFGNIKFYRRTVFIDIDDISLCVSRKRRTKRDVVPSTAY